MSTVMFGTKIEILSFEEDSLVETTVDSAYERGRKTLLIDPGRKFARDTVYASLATSQALCVLRSIDNERRFILIEEDKGQENSYIGGIGRSALPVLFMKLREKRI